LSERTTAGMPSFVGYLLCVLGGLVVGVFTPMACLLIGWGCVVVASGRNVGTWALTFVASLVSAGVGSLVVGSTAYADALLVCVVSVAVGYLLSVGKMTAGIGCIVVGLLTAAQLGVGAAEALLAGTDIATAYSQMANEYVQELGSVTGITADQTQLVITVVSYIWPSAYILSALAEFVCAYLGVQVGSSRCGEKSFQMPKLVDYDLPLWLVGVFVGSLVALAAGVSLQGVWSQVLLMVAINLIIALRFALMVQGFGVLAWLVQEKKPGALLTVIGTVVAVILEARFLVMSIVGLADVWINFRHLQRGTKTTVQDNTN
jgi:hypothetical protein